MKSNYSYLSDELAVMEIRKHKWIESQKAGQEIGFATAAIEWIKNYGEGWLNSRLGQNVTDSVFAEKRRHRRFSFSSPIQIKTKHSIITSYINDINLVALSCTVPGHLGESEPVEISLNLPQGASQGRSSALRYSSQVLRSKPMGTTKNHGYHTVIRLSEEIRDYLRSNPELFAHGRG